MDLHDIIQSDTVATWQPFAQPRQLMLELASDVSGEFLRFGRCRRRELVYPWCLSSFSPIFDTPIWPISIFIDELATFDANIPIWPANAQLLWLLTSTILELEPRLFKDVLAERHANQWWIVLALRANRRSLRHLKQANHISYHGSGNIKPHQSAVIVTQITT